MTVDPAAYIETAAAIAADLRGLGMNPVLVGGMALVVLGSRRVTRHFDFVISRPGHRLSAVVERFYARGFELVSRVDDAQLAAATIDNARVAKARLRIDEPANAYFYNPETLLRIDLLFDFPVAAAELAQRAMRMKIAGHVFAVAAESDLLRLKRIAQAARSFAGDAQDIAFLESRLRRVKAPSHQAPSPKR